MSRKVTENFRLHIQKNTYEKHVLVIANAAVTPQILFYFLGNKLTNCIHLFKRTICNIQNRFDNYAMHFH